MVCGKDAGVSEISGVTPCDTPSCVSPITVSIPNNCSCGCTPCSCGSATPFYNQAPGCQETHTQVFANQSYSAVIKTGAAFNMPACSVSVTISLPGVVALQPGSYLWSTTYGYLKVVSFDSVAMTAVVVNECQVSNAAPGTRIPGCTQFNVVDPPYEPGDECGEGSWVADDFVVPAIGSSIVIQVSNVSGLVIFQTVQIDQAIFKLEAIVTANSILIKNEGLAAPGLTIYARDAQGHCIAPITPFQREECASGSVSSGAIVVCNSGQPTVLDATAEGQIPVCVDPITNTFEAQNVYIERPVCGFVQGCFTLIDGVDTYTILVDDSSLYNVGDVVRFIDEFVDTIYFVVEEIVSSDTIKIRSLNPLLLPPEISPSYGINPYTQLCHVSCCEQLRYESEYICDQDWSTAQKGQVGSKTEATINTTLVPPNSYVGLDSSVEVVNDTCSTMRVMVTTSFIAEFSFNTNQDSWARVGFDLYRGFITVNLPLPLTAPSQVKIEDYDEDYTMGIGPIGTCSKYNSRHFKQYVYTEVLAIPPNSQLRYDAHPEVTYRSYVAGSTACCACGSLVDEGSGVLTIIDLNTRLQIIGLAIKE